MLKKTCRKSARFRLASIQNKCRNSFSSGPIKKYAKKIFNDDSGSEILKVADPGGRLPLYIHKINELTGAPRSALSNTVGQILEKPQSETPSRRGFGLREWTSVGAELPAPPIGRGNLSGRRRGRHAAITSSLSIKSPSSNLLANALQAISQFALVRFAQRKFGVKVNSWPLLPSG